MTKMYDINTSTQSDWITWANEHFGRLHSLIDELCKQLNNALTVDAWYATDIISPYNASLQGMRCPVFRWNYTDALLTKYVERFQIHDNKFGLFSLKEIVKKRQHFLTY